MSKQGIILLNLGSPDSTEVSDVRRYLREFLMDGRVLEVHEGDDLARTARPHGRHHRVSRPPVLQPSVLAACARVQRADGHLRPIAQVGHLGAAGGGDLEGCNRQGDH